MDKILNILKNHDTRYKAEYLNLIKNEPDLPKWSRLDFLKAQLKKQAKTVLDGECPCEHEIVGSTREVVGRDWQKGAVESLTYGICKFCGANP